ncbi:hypothetical protein HMPREF1860_01906 [Prevotella amnii]|uniref:Uncharacterized protein n=1 Tax=Prevotella amnii TaxID=419005 RepID=A0A134B551_9BACT|nr:DUF3853 family protein [Prevotella amnii]KXB75077.1 hypothetical protein HMPREF1860_01906 [Prevotella amnii]
MELFAMTEQQIETLAQRVATLVLQKDGLSACEHEKSRREFVYGIQGIASLFKVSRQTAQIYKNTWLKPAVSQRGRTIKVDKELALELFDKKQVETI